MRKQGRHKYFSLAGEEIATLLETLMGLSASNQTLKTVTGPNDAAMRNARVCYNHLAGSKGIQLYDSLLANQHLLLKNGNLVLSKKGIIFMQDFGINIEKLQTSRSPMCRECLDWSERRSHLAGSLGRALLTHFEKLKWITRLPDSRIIKFSAKGQRAFDIAFSADE